MKTTIEFYYEADYAYGLIIKNDGGTQIQLGVDGDYDFKTIGTSMAWEGAYICGGSNNKFAFKIEADDSIKYYAVSLRGGGGFCVICPINKGAYTFLKNIDLDKFVKLNLKMEFAD